MARIRSLKPEIWMSPQVMNLSTNARLLFIGLITQADDEGRGTADARRIKASIFGGDDCLSSNVRCWLDEVSKQGLAIMYDTVSHGLVYELPSWKTHQKIDRAKASNYPPPNAAIPPPPNPDPIVEPSSNARRGIVGDLIGSEGSLGSDLIVSAQTTSDRRIDAPDIELQIRSSYPPITGRQDWITALHHCRTMVDDGRATWERLLEGVRRYAAYKSAPGMEWYTVLSPAKFFGAPDQPWAQPWTVPVKPESAMDRAYKQLETLGEEPAHGRVFEHGD